MTLMICSSPRTPFKYTSITPPLCLFLYLFLTWFLIWNPLVKCLFILWRQWWPVFLGKRCATIVTWYYAIVDIVSPFLEQTSRIYKLMFVNISFQSLIMYVSSWSLMYQTVQLFILRNTNFNPYLARTVKFHFLTGLHSILYFFKSRETRYEAYLLLIPKPILFN